MTVNNLVHLSNGLVVYEVFLYKMWFSDKLYFMQTIYIWGSINSVIVKRSLYPHESWIMMTEDATGHEK